MGGLRRAVDDEWGGFEWSPSEMPSIHEFDFKAIINSNSLSSHLLNSIDMAWTLPDQGLVSIDMADFSSERDRNQVENLVFRAYDESATKRGLFVQAACIVTDGYGLKSFSNMLTCQRSHSQFYDSSQPRFTTGASCLISTPLASNTVLDKYGHVPSIVFNDLRDSNPFAIFSRKLLVPDVYVESRFFGLGYNLSNSSRKYLFLIWHVKTMNTPPVMLVDARRRWGQPEFDRMTWIPKERWCELRLPPVDKAVVEALSSLTPKMAGSPTTGYLPVHQFERIHQASWTFTTVNRDEIILDLFRIIQREFHSGRARSLPNGVPREQAFHEYIQRRLTDLGEQYGLKMVIVSQPRLGWGPGRGEPDLKIDIQLDREHRSFSYFVELKVDSNQNRRSEYLAQASRYREAARGPKSRLGRTRLGHSGIVVDAVLLVQGIWPNSKREAAQIDVGSLESELTIPDSHLPLHIFRMHLRAPTPSLSRSRKEVVHGLIPILSNGQFIGMLFHRGNNDPGFQPLGGKIEGFESPSLALKRELEEETAELRDSVLLGSDIEELEELFPATDSRPPGISLMMMSPTTKRVTTYRFHPFLIRLTLPAQKRLAKSLMRKISTLKIITLEQWLNGENAIGKSRYDDSYAKVISPLLTDEKIEWAGIEIGQGNPSLFL